MIADEISQLADDDADDYLIYDSFETQQQRMSTKSVQEKTQVIAKNSFPIDSSLLSQNSVYERLFLMSKKKNNIEAERMNNQTMSTHNMLSTA